MIPGDILGNGQIEGGLDTDNKGCARLCDVSKDCCSYEHSISENMCNLNRGCRPNGGKIRDFKFCVKG